jgi:hypothetical protein
VISAIVLINAEVDRIPEVAAAIAEIDGVSEVYSVTGMSTSSPSCGSASTRSSPTSSPTAQQGQRCLGTQTHIAFRTYSKHDLEAAFSLGLDDA